MLSLTIIWNSEFDYDFSDHCSIICLITKYGLLIIVTCRRTHWKMNFIKSCDKSVTWERFIRDYIKLSLALLSGAQLNIVHKSGSCQVCTTAQQLLIHSIRGIKLFVRLVVQSRPCNARYRRWSCISVFEFNCIF